jgi:hypothetical protein
MTAPGEPIGASATFRSQVLPVADVVLWGPTSAAVPQPFAEPYPILLHQAPLGQMLAHIHSAPHKTLLGFLLGGLFECPKSGVRYVVVNEIIRVGAEAQGDQTSDMLARLWPPLQQKLRTGAQQLIGWYHNHPQEAPALSREDVGAHMMYFTQPWQAGLVLGTEDARPAAAWFRVTKDDSWHQVQLPFYEVLTHESAEAPGKKRSFVPWANYKSYRATAPPPRAVPPPPGAVPPPPEPPVATASGFQPTGLPEPSARTPPRRPSVRQSSPDGSSEVTAAVEPPTPPPPRPPVEEEEEAPAPPVSRASVSIRRPSHVGRAFAAPAEPPGWKLWAAGAVGALLVALVVGVGWKLGMVRFEHLPRVASSAEPAPTPGLIRLDALADSVQQVLGEYRARRAGFSGQEAACAPLAQALVAVESHWARYSARGTPRALTLDPERAARDRSLSARVDSIESDFDRSTCQRP